MANQRGQYGSTGILYAATPEELIQDQARMNLEARGIRQPVRQGPEAWDRYHAQLAQEATRLRGSPTPGPIPDHNSPGVAIGVLGGITALVWGLSKLASKAKIGLPEMRVIQR